MMQLVFNGIVDGCIIALPAIAFTMLFAILKFANFSVGTFMTVGAFIALTLNVTLGLPIWVAALGTMLATALAYWLTDLIVFKSMRDYHSISLLIVSIALSLIVENIVRLFYGNDVRGFAVPLTRPIKWAGIKFTHDQLWIVGTAILAMVLVHILLRYTTLGKAMRATADNFQLAEVRGINTGRVITATWLLGGALIGLSGVFAGIDLVIEPTLGWSLTIPIFAAAILGGIGSPYGAMLGAILVGFAEELTGHFFSPSYKVAVGFAIIAVLLMFRPQGLFGQPEIKK